MADLFLVPDLFPLDDEEVTPEADVEAAAASALAASEPELAAPEVPQPFGRTALFDFGRGRMVRAGASPVWVSGHDALRQWCLMAIYSARYAHGVFTDDFGFEEPESMLGEAADAQEKAGDWGERLRSALTVHDRVADVEDYVGEFVLMDFPEGVARVFRVSFVVVTDEDERIDVGPLVVVSSEGA